MDLPVLNGHRLAPLRGKPPGTLLVHEVYRSIQGESMYAGFPCVFVRLTGCPARCKWCDTPDAFGGGTVRPLEGICCEVLAYECPMVEVTGGEPLAQPECLTLMTMLADADLTVLLETSGTVLIAGVDPRVHVVMDLKCPDSGECDNNLWANIDHLKRGDEVKFVVASPRDFDWAIDVIEHRLPKPGPIPVLSPVVPAIREAELAGWLLASGLDIRMQLQMHKYIWSPDAKGV
jgi:7-carboxy-7-deazaguanine synthase